MERSNCRERLPAGALQATTVAQAFTRTVRAAPGPGRAPHARRRARDHLGRVRRAGRPLRPRAARLGVERGDVVALMLTNRPEFHIADTAA